MHKAVKPKGGIEYAVTSILFDSENYNALLTQKQEETINNFFDSMQWETVKGTVKADINFGDLMKVVDLDNRYTYTGSLTTPPC